MAVIRVQLFLEQGKWGWSETYFYTGTSLSAALSDSKRLFAIRRQLLGVSAKLVYIRTSDDAVNRDSQVYHIPSPAGQVTPAFGVDSSDIPNTCLVCRMSAGDLYRRTLYLRGQPDDVVTVGGEYTPSPGFNAAFSAFVIEMVSGKWGLRVYQRVQPRIPIFQMLWLQAGLVTTMTTLVPHGLIDGDMIQITGRFATKGMNRRYQVSVLSPTQFNVPTPFLVKAYSGGAFFRKMTFEVATFTECDVVGVSHRITGRPFDSPHGRRRVR